MSKVSPRKQQVRIRRAIASLFLRLARWATPRRDRQDETDRRRRELRALEQGKKDAARVRELKADRRSLEKALAKAGRRLWDVERLLTRWAARPGAAPRAKGAFTEVDWRRLHREIEFVLDQARTLDRLDDESALARALVAFARASTVPERRPRARSVLLQLADRRGRLADAARVALGALSWRTGAEAFAWEQFQATSPLLAAELAADEYFAAVFRIGGNDARIVARGLLGAAADRLELTDVVALFEASFGAGDFETAEKALAFAEGRLEFGASAELEGRIAWYRSWVHRLTKRPSPAAPTAVHLGILSYGHADLGAASANLGDYTQTLASLTHVVRHRGLRFSGDADVVSIVEDLGRRVRPEFQLETPPCDVELHVVERDASSLSAPPLGTWLLAFGWYMKESFGQRFDFPFHPHVRPIFVSFHVNRAGMLSPQALEYLRQNGPVGCRDWATTYLLLSAGIDAFFSGCMTTTLDAYSFADQEAARQGETLYVDVKDPPDGAGYFAQEQEVVRTRGFVGNMREALARLDWYRQDFGRLVTSRLHTYLPARTIGMSVEFRAKNPADVRFDGLIGISDQELSTMRDAIREKLRLVTTAIFAGESEDSVRTLWRELCANEVKDAKDRLHRVPALRTDLDVAQVVSGVRATRRDRPRLSGSNEGEVHVEVSLDGNLKHQLEVVLASVLAHTAAPVHVHVLGRDLTRTDQERVERLFPELTLSWFSFDGVDYGKIRLLHHITVATMDRLLLPDLLPEVPRIIHLDLDLIVRDDVAKLFSLDLEGNALAARDSPFEKTSSGIGTLLLNLRALSAQPDRARLFLQRTLARHAFDFSAFNAGVLVLDLDRMRGDRFCSDILPCAVEYGLHDQDLLNYYAGPRKKALDGRWNVNPRVELLVDPGIVHWAGTQKPWGDAFVSGQSFWDEGESRLAIRVAKNAV